MSPACEAAERNHSAENEGPDSHDASAHFVGDDALQDRVGSGEIEHDAEADDREKHGRNVKIFVEGEERERHGKNPDAAERHDPRREDVPGAGDRERRGQRADAAARHQHAVTVRAQMQDVLGERGHEHGIGPAENSDDGEERKNGEDAPMTPNVTKPFQSLADRARLALDRVARFGSRIRRSPVMTAMKLRPSSRKHMAMPTCAMRNPAIDGPMMRAQLKAELLSEIAFIKSSRLVISITNDCRAGMSKAIVIPPRIGEHDDVPRLHDLGPNERGHRERQDHLARSA